MTEIKFEKMCEITRELIKRYAFVSRDHNPIHVDDEVAKKSGLPGVIAHGMLTAAYMAKRADDFSLSLDGSWEVSRFQTRFKSMCFPGDIVSVGGKIKSQTEQECIIQIKAVNQKDAVLCAGVVHFKKLAD